MEGGRVGGIGAGQGRMQDFLKGRFNLCLQQKKGVSSVGPHVKMPTSWHAEREVQTPGPPCPPPPGGCFRKHGGPSARVTDHCPMLKAWAHMSVKRQASSVFRAFLSVEHF